MATLAEFGISSINELTNEATYYSVDDEVYLYTDGLHVLIGCYQLRESIHYIHVGGHPVEGHWKATSRQRPHLVSGYTRGGYTKREIKTERILVASDHTAYVGPLDIISNRKELPNPKLTP